MVMGRDMAAMVVGRHPQEIVLLVGAVLVLVAALVHATGQAGDGSPGPGARGTLLVAGLVTASDVGPAADRLDLRRNVRGR